MEKLQRLPRDGQQGADKHRFFSLSKALQTPPSESLTEPRKKKRRFFLGTDIPVTGTHFARAGTAACSTRSQVYRHLWLCTGS